VAEARDAADYSDVVRVGIDDTAKRRGQSYISIMANLDGQRTVAVTQGRDKGAVGRLCSELEPCQYNGQRNLRFFMRSASPLDRDARPLSKRSKNSCITSAGTRSPMDLCGRKRL
jgi:hypothetical protein